MKTEHPMVPGTITITFSATLLHRDIAGMTEHHCLSDLVGDSQQSIPHLSPTDN